MRDSKKRSLIKTLTWRLTGSGATFLISFLLTGNFAMAGSIAVVQLFANTILYYFHERIWANIDWDR